MFPFLRIIIIGCVLSVNSLFAQQIAVAENAHEPDDFTEENIHTVAQTEQAGVLSECVPAATKNAAYKSTTASHKRKSRISATSGKRINFFSKLFRPKNRHKQGLVRRADPFIDQCLSDCISAMCQEMIDWACSDFFPSLFDSDEGVLFFILLILLLALVVAAVIMLA